ncbi:MAG: hypothetical protein IPM16_06655 [Chloroflexi bacterium]|nr:hypothetical protein [Chloroflexota bacterium]
MLTPSPDATLRAQWTDALRLLYDGWNTAVPPRTLNTLVNFGFVVPVPGGFRLSDAGVDFLHGVERPSPEPEPRRIMKEIVPVDITLQEQLWLRDLRELQQTPVLKIHGSRINALLKRGWIAPRRDGGHDLTPDGEAFVEQHAGVVLDLPPRQDDGAPAKPKPPRPPAAIVAPAPKRTNTEKREAIAQLLRDGDWVQYADREIARSLDVDHKTVAAIRAELEAAGEIETVDTRLFLRGDAVIPMQLGDNGAHMTVEFAEEVQNLRYERDTLKDSAGLHENRIDSLRGALRDVREQALTGLTARKVDNYADIVRTASSALEG